MGKAHRGLTTHTQCTNKHLSTSFFFSSFPPVLPVVRVCAESACITLLYDCFSIPVRPGDLTAPRSTLFSGTIPPHSACARRVIDYCHPTPPQGSHHASLAEGAHARPDSTPGTIYLGAWTPVRRKEPQHALYRCPVVPRALCLSHACFSALCQPDSDISRHLALFCLFLFLFERLLRTHPSCCHYSTTDLTLDDSIYSLVHNSTSIHYKQR